jgi:lysophospholipase L1-like esterase
MRLLAPVLAATALATAAATPTRVMVIGDSMSEEYAHELPFSAPDSNPLNPNTRNWIESLDALRSADLDFGTDGAYPDLRGLGFKYNWGVPGATAEFWAEVLGSSLLDDPQYLTSKFSLLNRLDDIDVVVLFVGGNDVSSDYGNLYNNAPSPGEKDAYLAHVRFIIETLRGERSEVPIVLVNVPDVGATPDIQEDHPDPVRRLDATAHIADLNKRLASAVMDDPHLVVVDLFALTAQILDPAPFTIGPVTMVKSYDRENRPNFLFCKEKFHPASGASALIGNAIVGGINSALGTTIAPLTDTEIAARILELKPYLDWIATFPGADADLLADHDHDGLPNIGEFALNTHPLVPDAPAPSSGFPASVTYSPNPLASDTVEVIPEESTDLQFWAPVPLFRLTSNSDDSHTAELPIATRAFARLRFPLAP